MLKVIGTHVFDIFGDGRSNEMKFSIRNMRTPSPMAEGMYPTGIATCKMTGGAGGTVTGQLDGEIVTLTFGIPPSAGKVTIDFLYGKSD